MAMTVAAMAAKGSSKIDDPECVSKSFPQFFEILEGAAR
jgi:5-enolpyruvylshikimate-3-phosphate synthase